MIPFIVHVDALAYYVMAVDDLTFASGKAAF